MTTTAIDVVKYIESKMVTSGETQTHKLAYFAQAWHLAWTGRPLFHDRIEAWKNGPVVKSLRYVRVEADPSALEPDDAATVDAIIEHYGSLYGSQLSAITHAEGPWVTVRGTLPDGAACDDEIPLDLMRKFYTAKAASGNAVPIRRTVQVDAADDDVLAIARANAMRWETTLRLLGE